MKYYYQSGIIKMEDIRIRLEAYLDHYKYAMLHLPKSSQTYSHCQKEYNAITELLSKPEVLQIYVETWNKAIEGLYNIKAAVADYGPSISSLFNLEYLANNDDLFIQQLSNAQDETIYSDIDITEKEESINED